jgi:hypothetical protein
MVELSISSLDEKQFWIAQFRVWASLTVVFPERVHHSWPSILRELAMEDNTCFAVSELLIQLLHLNSTAHVPTPFNVSTLVLPLRPRIHNQQNIKPKFHEVGHHVTHTTRVNRRRVFRSRNPEILRHNLSLPVHHRTPDIAIEVRNRNFNLRKRNILFLHEQLRPTPIECYAFKKAISAHVFPKKSVNGLNPMPLS